MAETVPAKSLLVVLHDVAPQSWPRYAPFIAELERLGRIPLSLLVVPDFHHRSPLEHHPEFVSAIERRLAEGDEVLLHGYFHADDGPPPRGPSDYLMRRLYTREGEFQTADSLTAGSRLANGLGLFDRLGWPVTGFVAPAWLMSPATRRALIHSGLRYTSDRRNLYRLPDFQPVAAPGLVWSARAAWRRALSQGWNRWQRRRLREAPVLRLGLHPVDLEHRAARHFWLESVEALLQQRLPLTKGQWLERQP